MIKSWKIWVISVYLWLQHGDASLKPVKGPVTAGKLIFSPIGAGTWSWGNTFLWGYDQSQDAQLAKTFQFVADKGINWFDTADSYGTGALAGRSEVLLGQFKKQSKRKVSYCTKIAPFPWIIGKDAMYRTIEASSARLQRPIDVLQLHWPPTLGWQEDAYLDAFASALENKLATQLGLSNFGPNGLQRIAKKLDKRGIKAYTNQIQFSLLSRLPLKSGLVEECADLGIQPIAYSPLALGLLTDRYTIDKLPSGPRFILFREYLPVMKPLLQELREVARQRKKSVAQVTLNWVLNKGFLILVGMRSVEQATDSLGALGWSLTEAEVFAIDKAADKVPKSLIQNANQSD